VRAVLAALHGRVDGLILMNPAAEGEGLDAAARRTPAIVLNAPPAATPHDSIRVDNRGGARAAVEHLLYLGHRAIATITGPEGNSDAADRTLGYREALAARGVEVDPAWILPGAFDEASGFRAGAAFARLLPRPTAIFAANDAMAIGCLAALTEHGLAVPTDVSLAGFDDVPMARYLTPGLTSVRVAIADLGERAVERLLGAIRDGAERKRHHEVVAATLVPRGSTGPPADSVPEANATKPNKRKPR
jgi:LacI family transcriptional regulator